MLARFGGGFWGNAGIPAGGAGVSRRGNIELLCRGGNTEVPSSEHCILQLELQFKNIEIPRDNVVNKILQLIMAPITLKEKDSFLA